MTLGCCFKNKINDNEILIFWLFFPLSILSGFYFYYSGKVNLERIFTLPMLQYKARNLSKVAKVTAFW